MSSFMQLKNECLPAFVYLLIALVSVTIMFIVTLTKGKDTLSGFFRFLANLVIIFVCTWIVTFGCKLHVILGWIIVLILYVSNYLVYYL